MHPQVLVDVISKAFFLKALETINKIFDSYMVNRLLDDTSCVLHSLHLRVL